MTDADNKALIDEIINPTPGLVVDDALNVDTQIDFQNSDLDTSFTLSNTLQERLDDILEKARNKISSLKFPGEATVDIPNDSLYPHSQIKTEDIYIDDNLRDMLYPGDPMYFKQPSTDNRRDFELNVSRDDLIVFKSPTLNFVSIAKKDLKESLDKIIEDLDLSFKQTLTSEDDRTKTKQKINILKNLNKRFHLIKKAHIEKQLQSHEWLTKLVEDQFKLDKTTYHTFGDNFESGESKNKFKNVIIRKRKLLLLTSEDIKRYTKYLY